MRSLHATLLVLVLFQVLGAGLHPVAARETGPSQACQRALQALRSSSPDVLLRELESLPVGVQQDLPCLAARASALFSLGRYEDAETLYELAAKLAPAHADVHFNLGLSRLKSAQVVLGSYMVRQDQARGAEDAFRRASELRPDEPRHRHHVGLSLELRQDDSAALAEYAKALEIDPAHGPSHVRSGVLLLQEGETEKAVAALTRGVQLEPKDGDAAYHLGKALLRAGEAARAVEVLRRAIEISPSSSEAHFNLARALTMLGREEEAAAVRQRFETLNTSGLDSASARLAAMAGEGQGMRDHRFHYTLAARHEREGRLDEALKGYRRALQLAPGLAALQLRAGIVSAQLGQLEDAEVHVREALRLDPTTPSARDVLNLILQKTGRATEVVETVGRKP